MRRDRFTFFAWFAVFSVLLQTSSALALDAPRPSTLRDKAFFKPELHLSSSNVAVDGVGEGLANRPAWDRFARTFGRPQTFLDPRSGIPSNVITSIPLLPGTGDGNRVGLDEVSLSLGRRVAEVDSTVVGELVRNLVVGTRESLALDTSQLGTPRVAQVSDDLWHVSFPQMVDGLEVRYARLAAVINHGNLILLGTETWGNANVDTHPRVTAEEAIAIGFAYIGGQETTDGLWKRPTLEILPVAPAEFESGETFVGPMGAGYRHRLAWSFGITREGDDGTWEALVDAHTGEMLAFQDQNHYVSKKIAGGAYPLTSTEICPSVDRCGTMQPDQPMPYADTGLAAPNDFTNGAGVFTYPGGTVTTQLAGKYVKITDACGAVSESAAGNIALGGTNGQHDCASAGASSGNTASSRSAYYEVNKLAELARGWLPGNAWLQSQLGTNVNINDTCNAFYDTSAGTINFYRSGGGCRNTGEIAGVFDHEWGHALDDNDSGGALSNTSEAYADIAAIYRLRTPCIGYGFFATMDAGCGMTADGTGFNNDESQTATTHCDVECSGVRSADFLGHADHLPDTPANFTCVLCGLGPGPCGREEHCEAAPGNQAAWDLAARDLQVAPFSLSADDAFIVATKVFFQGSGNIGNWQACTCPATSNGCGATNAYMQWLAADDDNGNLADGTPHMTALFAAFDRHGIACAAPAPQNSGCAGGPTAAPGAVTPATADNQVSLAWPPVPGAVAYRVLRSEGIGGCGGSKTLIAEIPGTIYNDTQVVNGRAYSYVIQAVGASSACFGPVSVCVTVIPRADVDLTYVGATSGQFSDPVTLAADLELAPHVAPIAGETISFTLGTQSCSGVTNAAGRASCSITLNQHPGPYTLQVVFAGSSTLKPKTISSPFAILREDTQTTYTGVLTADYHDPAAVSGLLVDPDGSGGPIAGRTLTFTLGGVDTCSGVTNASGVASCTLIPTRVPATYPIVASFAGDLDYRPSSDTKSFLVTKEQTRLTYTGPGVAFRLQPVVLRARMFEDDARPAGPGRTVTFRLGTQICIGTTDATGAAMCTIVVNQTLGPKSLQLNFTGDAFYLPSTLFTSLTVTQR